MRKLTEKELKEGNSSFLTDIKQTMLYYGKDIEIELSDGSYHELEILSTRYKPYYFSGTKKGYDSISELVYELAQFLKKEDLEILTFTPIV